MRLIRIGLLTVAVMTATATPAAADPATTTTDVEHHLVATFQGTFPCGGETYDITFTETFVLHTTIKDATLHQAATGVGSLLAVPADGTGTTYTGHFAFRFGPTLGGPVVVSTTRMHVVVSGDDGSRLSQVILSHLNVSASGEVVIVNNLVC
jgi:hypothetical protein